MGQDGPSVVFEDNQGSFSHRLLQARHFRYAKVGTKEQLADAFTKALPRDDFNRFRSWMGVTVFEQDFSS